MRFSKSYVVLLLIILLAFVLRVYQLDFFSLRGDESFTVLFVQKPLAQMWEETLTIEPNPPLLYFLLRGWIAVAEASEFATRFFSVWFGVLCVALVYRLAREISRGSFGNRESTRHFLSHESYANGIIANGNSTALIAAFLMALNPYQIWHSQDVRNYTLWPALSLLVLVFFWRWYASNVPRTFGSAWHVRRSAWHLSAFVVAELAALYAHYYEAFILLALNVFVFVTLWREWKKLAQWIGAQIVLAILYLPYPLILSNRVSAYGEGSGRQDVALWDVARETFSAFVLSDTLEENLRAWLWIPFALVALAGLIILCTRDWKRGLFFVLYASMPTLAVFAINTIRPLYLERYLNGIAPAYYLLLAYGIVQLSNMFHVSRFTFLASRSVILLAISLAAFFALSNYWTNPAYAKAPDWRGLANIINANAQRGDLIVQNFPETSLLYYDKSKLPLVVYPETFLPDTKTTQQLNALNANYQRVWFIPAAPDFWDPDQFVESWLDHRDDLLKDWRVENLRLHLYATPSQYLNGMTPTNLVLGDMFALRGYRTERIGDSLRVVLYWRALQTPQNSYAFKLQALDDKGADLQELGSIPVRGAYPTNEWRKNESVVDQYDFANAANIQAFRVLVCDGDLCEGAPDALAVTK